MKILVLVMAALFVAAAPAQAQLPETAGVGLYADESHLTWCVTGEPMYQFDMWIWCQPGANGLLAVEFAVDYPAGVIPAAAQLNDRFLSPPIGDLPNGVAAVALACVEDWIWAFRQPIYVMSPEQMEIRLKGYIGNPQYDVPIYTACEAELGFPIYIFRIMSDLCINYPESMLECSALATEDASWGAIKSLAR